MVNDDRVVPRIAVVDNDLLVGLIEIMIKSAREM
jgi:hypothetical protein